MRIPSVVTADQRREFRNHANDELMKIFNIQHHFTTAYHPQANGLHERLNQALVSSLAKFAQDSCETWDAKLNKVVYAYNTGVQEPTKYAPFEAMFGRLAQLPIDFNATSTCAAVTKQQEYQDAKNQIAVKLL